MSYDYDMRILRVGNFVVIFRVNFLCVDLSFFVPNGATHSTFVSLFM
jgi:hypothetical protein